MASRGHKRPKSISFSLAFVRVCEWAREPGKYFKPSVATLAEAEKHALELGDNFILEKIEEIREHYRVVEATPTPELPGPTKIALKVASETVKTFRNPAKEINAFAHEDEFAGGNYVIVNKGHNE